MRQSLGQVDQMRQHFVQNVSHEIKTPLTHMQDYTQLQFSKIKRNAHLILMNYLVSHHK